jgi:signal transduction histidine kinase
MVCVDPAKLPAAKTTGPTFIENILVDERPVPFTASLIVGPDYDRIEVRYTAINFSNPNNVRFKYFVKELFTNWTAPSANRFAVLMNLSPGTYHFNVVNCSNDGLWNETPTTITIVIRAHFYQTAWFYAALFLLIPFGVAFAALWRIRFLERQTKHLNTLVEEKIKDLSDEKQNSENAYIEMRKAKETAEQEKEKAEQANFQKSELMNIMMHDLKNPIISINGGATLITENPEDTEMVKHMGTIIANSSARMTDLVSKLHEHNKLENFYVRMDIHPVNVIELIHTVIKKNESLAAKKQQQIQLISEINNELTIQADAEKLYSALDNLLNNAVKYSPTGKTIWLSVSATKEILRMSIRDEGPGLTEEDLRYVFGKFQRLSARPTADESSTGLGLSIVKQIVELHKGIVWVESKNNEGAEFIIELPL